MYYSDKPILTSEEDSLKRKYFAEVMAKALINLQNIDTYLTNLITYVYTGRRCIWLHK